MTDIRVMPLLSEEDYFESEVELANLYADEVSGFEDELFECQADNN